MSRIGRRRKRSQRLSGNGQSVVLLPGGMGTTMTCGTGVLNKLNGMILLHMAFVVDAAPEAYWTMILFGAVGRLCEAEKP